MRVIHAGLSCLILASVIACGGQSAENGPTDAGLSPDSEEEDESTKPDKPSKDDESDDSGESDDTEDPGDTNESDESGESNGMEDGSDDERDDGVLLDGGPNPDATGSDGTSVGTGTNPDGTGGSGGSGGSDPDDSSIDPNAGGSGGMGNDGAGGTGPIGGGGVGNEETDDTDPGPPDDPSDPDVTDDSDPTTGPTPTDEPDTDTDPPIVLLPPELPPFDVPADCNSQSISNGTSSCGGSFSCDGGYVSSYCSVQADFLNCSCDNGTGYVNYELHGVAEDDRCNYPLELCRSGNLDQTGPETCQNTPISGDAQNCYSQKVCSQALDLGGGITAKKQVGYGDLSCYDNGTDDWYCYCYDEISSTNYTLQGATEDTACEAMAPVCLNGVEPTYAEPECEDQGSEDQPTYCSMYQYCTEAADLGSGVSVSKETSTSSYCSELSDGSWSCDCYNFAYTTEADAENYCSQSTTVCEAAREYEDWGTSDACDVPSTSVYEGQCNAQVECSWDITLADVPVTISGRNYMYCYDSEDEAQWQCYCENGGSSFMVDKGDEELSSCEAAAMNCAAGARPGGNGGIPMPGPIFIDGGVGVSEPAPAAPAVSR